MKNDLRNNENDFYKEIRLLLEQARKQTYALVNTVMVETYWQIGRRIVMQEQKGKERADYQTYLIKKLSKYLGDEFGKGFSIANLKNCRQFFLTFRNDQKGYTLCSQLSWSHIRLIMRLDTAKIREYYLKESREQNWSVRLLERNIKTNYYQRLLSSQKNLSFLQKDDVKVIKDNYIKDPYILEFLGLPENEEHHESALEQLIIKNMQRFLLELGKGFSFVGRQYRISTETSHFYIDLVFYNYLLKCFVLIDLKTKKLIHQDIGQMDMYIRMFDDLKRGEDDNPTLGIILCANKDETMVKYSVLKESEQIFASQYKTILPSEKELTNELERERYL